MTTQKCYERLEQLSVEFTELQQSFISEVRSGLHLTDEVIVERGFVNVLQTLDLLKERLVILALSPTEVMWVDQRD